MKSSENVGKVFLEPYEVPGMAKLFDDFEVFKPKLVSMLRKRRQVDEDLAKVDFLMIFLIM